MLPKVRRIVIVMRGMVGTGKHRMTASQGAGRVLLQVSHAAQGKEEDDSNEKDSTGNRW